MLLGNAAQADWEDIYRLSKDEWPKGTLEYMSFSIIKRCSEVRLASGVPMVPSPLFDAHVRHEGNSVHSTQGKTRLARATDYFIKDAAQVFKMWESCVRNPKIGGIGVYLDTIYQGKPTVMFHIDERENPLWWVRTGKNEYTYHIADPKKFFNLLATAADYK